MGSKPPFGYVKASDNKHQLIIDPPAAEIVKRLYREFACGETGRSIAAKLNAEGVDTPAVYYYKQTGKRATRGDNCQQWGSATITQLLRNHVYIGHMVQGKRKVSSFKTKKRLSICPDDWVIVENTHSPIIDEFTWEQVRQRLEKAKNAPSNCSIKTSSTGEISLFSGIIRCADCGAAMVSNRKERKGGYKNTYRCSRYVNNGRNSCTIHYIDAELLEFIVLKDIQHHAETALKEESQLLSRLLSFSEQERRNGKAAQEKALRDAATRIAFIEDASKRLFEEKIAGNMPDTLFKKMLADYTEELSALEEQAASIRRGFHENEQNETDINRWLELIKECVSIDRLDRATAYQLIDHVAIHEQCDECGIRTQDIQIKYNFVGCLSQAETQQAV